jgi:tetratricopeptide (TPR) repeat protein
MRVSKSVVAAVLVVVILALGGGVLWYLSVPHTPEAQFAYAEKLEKALRGDALTKSPKALEPQVAEAEEQYRRVGTRFGKSPKAAEALKRIAKIDEEVAKATAKAITDLDDLAKDYPDDDNAGFALVDQARLIRAQADELKTGRPDDAVAKYKQALAKLADYRKQFAAGKQADPALMEIGRIWQDGLGDPPIRAIETFETFLKTYPQSDNRPEAMYRLAKLYDGIKEYAHALQLYSQLLEEFPRNKWADEATFARAKILDQQMKKHDEAAKEFERLEKDYPDSPLTGQAGGEAKKAHGEEASQEGETYGKSRYGSLPYDTIRDKPLPPSGMFRQFAEEKLDAQKYDLHVEFQPADHRISVTGTLSLINRGDDKNQLLLMLGTGFNLSKLTVDNAPANSDHQGETLKITLASPLKKDAAATIGFAYTAQFAEPQPDDMVHAPSAAKKLEPSDAPPPATTTPATLPAHSISKYAYNPQIGLGEFGYGLSGASWYPITLLGDVFDAHITIKTPANIEAVSNGEAVRRQKSTVEGVPSIYEFQTKSPIFGIYFAYGPYVVQEKQIGAIHYYTYFRPENTAKTDDYLKVTNNILTFYGSKFVPFPFEKMAMVEVPLPPFLGGVGPASLMFLHQKMVAHKEVPENLLAHELAHQWFGNLIPINIADPGYSQWLSEGFATYCDALYTEHTEGEEAFVKHIERYDQLYFQFEMMAARGQGAIRDTFPDSGLYRPVIYEKGALVLHMLRKVMGDDKFFSLMRQYVETYKNKPTTVDDFRRLASTVYGQDLSWFFSQWIDQAVFAHWKVNAAITDGTPEKIAVTVTQPDDLVKMPVDITLTGSGGERLVVPNVMLDSKEQTLHLTAPFKPTHVILDENYWVLHHPGSDNIWPAEKAAAATP